MTPAPRTRFSLLTLCTLSLTFHWAHLPQTAFAQTPTAKSPPAGIAIPQAERDELTQAALYGEINFRRFTHLGDEEIIQELVPLFGIGRWTVEMFLIFQLGRLDVWPVDDLAVRRGWDNLHKNTEPIKAKVLQQLGEPFIGMRSVVAWYCWRAS